jgi:SAM-dependent methyltransferase
VTEHHFRRLSASIRRAVCMILVILSHSASTHSIWNVQSHHFAGAGWGAFTKYLADAFGLNSSGAFAVDRYDGGNACGGQHEHGGSGDIGEASVSSSDRRKTGSSDDRVSFVYGDALSLPFANGSVDVVSCVCVLHHLDDPAAAIRCAARHALVSAPR